MKMKTTKKKKEKVKYSKDWQPFLENAAYVIRKNKTFFDGQLRAFKNAFDVEIEEKGFRKLLSRVKPKLHILKEFFFWKSVE